MARMDTAALGHAAQAMGAGRLRKEDPIDPAVGFILKVRLGDRVEPETELCQLHARTEADADRAEQAIRSAIELTEAPCEKPAVILARVDQEGVHLLEERQ